MNPSIRALYRRARLKAQHRAGFQAGQNQRALNEQAEKAEHFVQAFHSGKVAAISGVSEDLSEDIMIQKEADFIDPDSAVDINDVAEIDEDGADDDEAANDEADDDISDIDEADFDDADDDEADEVQ